MLTVTAHEAVRLVPSCVVAMMTQVPLPTAVTRPLALTVATPLLVLSHITLLSVALLGLTVAFSWAVCPASVKERLFWSNVMLCAGTGRLTVT